MTDKTISTAALFLRCMMYTYFLINNAYIFKSVQKVWEFQKLPKTQSTYSSSEPQQKCKF